MRSCAAQTHGKGVVGATRGNHGQSIGFAAARYGIPAALVVPHGNSVGQEPRDARARRRADRARARLPGVARSGRRHRGRTRLALRFPRSIRSSCAASASYALELLRAAPDLDTLYVPIGLGSGICGAMAARDALGLATNIVGVVSAAAPAYARSARARRARVARGDDRGSPTGWPAARRCRRRSPSIRAGRRARRRSHRRRRSRRRCARSSTTPTTSSKAPAPPGSPRCCGSAIALRGRSVGIVLTGANVDAGPFGRILLGLDPVVSALRLRAKRFGETRRSFSRRRSGGPRSGPAKPAIAS